jgi:hypothetical protein
MANFGHEWAEANYGDLQSPSAETLRKEIEERRIAMDPRQDPERRKLDEIARAPQQETLRDVLKDIAANTPKRYEPGAMLAMKNPFDTAKPYQSDLSAKLAEEQERAVKALRKLMQEQTKPKLVVPQREAIIGIGGGPIRATTLPTEAAERKKFPIATGFFDYFPDAIAAIAYLSWKANEQHNPGQPVHWARGKSTDHDDTLLRHFAERGTIDTDGVRHRTKVAWRALAALQEEIEEAMKKEAA